MTARQLLATALAVPVRRVHESPAQPWALFATTGRVRWRLQTSADHPKSGWLSATAGRHTIHVDPSRQPLAATVAEIRAGLRAMGVRVPTIILSRDGATLYALRAGAPEAIGYATATHVCVYEPVGDDQIKHRREHIGDPRAVLIAELGRYWPGEVVA